MAADIPAPGSAVTPPGTGWRDRIDPDVVTPQDTPVTAAELTERDTAINATRAAVVAIREALNTGDVPDGFTAAGSAVDTAIAEAIAALPPSVTQAEVDTAIAEAIAALPPTVTQEQVDTAIADAIAALPPSVTAEQVESAIDERIPPPLTPAQVVDEVLPAGSVTFGTYSEDVGRAPGSRIREITRWGLRPRLTLSYPKLNSRWVDLNTAPVYGTVPVITWEPMVADTDPPVLAAVAAGDHDDDVRRGCREVAEAIEGGMTVIIRFMHEMNGDWYPWCGPVNDATGATAASAYIAAFRHVAAIIREELPSTPIMWAPNASSHPDEPWNNASAYYPGGEWVDVIGLDGYDWGDDRAQTFAEIFTDVVAELTPLGKPIVVAETGSAATGVSNRAAWVRDMWETLTTDLPQVRGLIWFDSNKERTWAIGAQGDIPAWAEVSAQMTPLPTAPSWAQALDRVADRTTYDPLGLYAVSTFAPGIAAATEEVVGPAARFARVVYGSGRVRSIGLRVVAASAGANVQVCVFRSEGYGATRRPGWREGDSGSVPAVVGWQVVPLWAAVDVGPDDFLAIATDGEVTIEAVAGGGPALALGLAYSASVFPIPWSVVEVAPTEDVPLLVGLT